jgi:hypothetical protein
MAAPYLFHEIQPENSKSQYTEFNNLDFVMTFEGRKLLCNSVKLQADLRITKGGANITDSEDIKMDASIGAHGVVESINTSFQNVGRVENLNSYPRYVGMVADTTTTKEDMCNSENICEMRAMTDKILKVQLSGFTTDASGSTTNNPNSFSIKPLFVLNSAVGKEDPNNVELSFKKSGVIRVSFTLARVFNLLFGNDVDSTCSYTLTNVRLAFTSVPEDNVANTLIHKTKYHIKQSILSSRSNVAAQVPAVCNAVSTSFVRQSEENAAIYNSYQRQHFPLLDQLQYLFNNNTNARIQYTIKNKQDALQRYISSFRDVKHSQVNLVNLSANKAYGLGLFWEQYVNLANQTFNISLNSADSTISADPFSIHAYFHSVVEV